VNALPNLRRSTAVLGAVLGCVVLGPPLPGPAAVHAVDHAAHRKPWQPRQSRFAWPLFPRPPVTRAFDAPAHRYGPGHRGVDLATVPGQPLRAAAAGTVVFAGRVAGRGVVSIAHAGGLHTTYEPVQASVAAGDRVTRGQVVGTVAAGHPGCPAPACLHWGVRRSRDVYLDPLRLVRLDVVLRLKPWEGVGPVS
jgi:murein DD-endopeptidase MepM/ murein hydrolase activator NlpD